MWGDEEIFVSAFIENSPFKKSASEIEEIQFQGAEKQSINGIEVIADKEMNIKPLVREMFAFTDNNGDGKFTQGTDKFQFKYIVKVFVSKNDAYLRKLFENCSPKSNEVCVFLEDNSGDIISGSSAYVKIGRVCYFNLVIRTDDVASTGSGTLRVGNLPFSSANAFTVSCRYAVSIGRATNFNNARSDIVGEVEVSSNYIQLYYNHGANGFDATELKDGTNQSQFEISGFYVV